MRTSLRGTSMFQNRNIDISPRRRTDRSEQIGMRLSTTPTNARPKAKSRVARPTPDSPWNGLPEEFEDIFLTPVQLGILLFKENLAQPILNSLDGKWLPTEEEFSQMTQYLTRSMGDTFDEATRIIQRLIMRSQLTEIRNLLGKLGELDLLRQIGSIKFTGSVTDGQGGTPSR